MSCRTSLELGRAVVAFFQDYLPAQRGMSKHTVRSYRDAIVLCLPFVACDAKRRVETLQIADLTSARIERFLTHLETDRRNGIATRNARLAALHTFARFLGSQHIEQLALVQSILAIPFKRGAPHVQVEYPDSSTIQALMSNIDRGTPSGRRDYALFSLMLNTGARVQEVLDLRVRDFRLEPPEQVRLQCKGEKIRLCPLWPRTARLMRDLIASQVSLSSDPSASIVFRNRNGAPLTRFGVRYLLRKHLPDYRTGARRRRIHPHALRHATAVYLLKSGNDYATVSDLLGHASLATTMRYTRADLDMKRQALAQVFPDLLGAPTASQVNLRGPELTRWLRRL
jgi:integrase/recombinase XerD